MKTLTDLKQAKPPEWIFKGVIAPSVITLFSSPPKLGKTTFWAWLLRMMWTSEEYLGVPIRPVPTLIFSEEADERIASRCMDLGYSEVWPIFWETLEPGRTWIHILAAVKDFAQTWQNSLIIIDTLSRHWGIEDENNNAMVEKVLNPLLAIVRKTGCALVLIHHTRKSGGTGGVASRGGSALVGAVDIIAEMSRVERGDKTNRRRMEVYSRYDSTFENVIIQLSEEGYVLKKEDQWDADDPSAATTVVGTSTETKARQWLRTHPGWWQAAAVAAALGMSERTVSGALGFLVSREEIDCKGAGRKGDPHVYAGTEEMPTDG